jgi:DNA repair protein RadD
VSFALRPYQQLAVDVVRSEYVKGATRVVLVSPTGSGKTVMFSHISSMVAAKGKRIVIVAHRREIVDQISRALTEMGVPHGMIVAGQPTGNEPVQVAMVQTLAKRLDKMTAPDLLVIDEAHHGVAGQWRAVTDAWTSTKILGVTAIPERLDGKGLGGAFDVMVQGPTVASLILDGHLAGYEYLAPPTKLDMSGVKTRGGDFAIEALAEAVDKPSITGDAVEHYRETLNGRPAIAFCVTVEHAQHVAQQFRDAGFAAASVDGTMTKEARRDLVASLADGRLNVLTSCELISEGVDVPVVAGAILLRPTKSLGMFLQQVGRCLRKKPDGSAAVILDHVGNVHHHGLPDEDRDWALTGKAKKQIEGVSTCKMCFRVFPTPEVCASGFQCPTQTVEVCPYTTEEGKIAAAKEAPSVVEGKLTKFVKNWDWAEGIDAKTARGRDWNRLLTLADSEDKLKMVQKARGYKRGWTKHVLADRGLVHEFLTGSTDVAHEVWKSAPTGVLWGIVWAVDQAEKGGEHPPHWPGLKWSARAEINDRRGISA